ncbi:hypothetical protein FSP39_018998 [Pinctada imbricata]|uniref:SANT domain-containing protein n=1 Tax=Pinctada imbricata TaxID=66713 RepID=A0AA89C1R4_PINIB|nr:hypothetical protein FSP39_018998 [Pinctada imbricata]
MILEIEPKLLKSCRLKMYGSRRLPPRRAILNGAERSKKVGEIFTAAGAAFSKLGDLTLQLHPTAEPSPSSGKWTQYEIDLLRKAVKRFGDDLDAISEVIKTRTISQIKTQMKRKAFEDAGLPQPTEPSPKKQAIKIENQPKPVSVVANTTSTSVATMETQKKQKQNDVTLSALNAPESDVDIEGDSSSSKRLDFDSGPLETMSLFFPLTLVKRLCQELEPMSSWTPRLCQKLEPMSSWIRGCVRNLSQCQAGSGLGVSKMQV